MNGMKQINLQDYGLNRNFITQSMEYYDLYLARIISQEKNFYQAVCVNGVLFAEVSGKLRFEATIQSDFPTVGDFVMLDRCNNKNGNAIIHHVLHRKSLFVRKAAGKVNEEQVVAANIDIVFLCMSLNKDFNITFLFLSISNISVSAFFAMSSFRYKLPFATADFLPMCILTLFPCI